MAAPFRPIQTFPAPANVRREPDIHIPMSVLLRKRIETEKGLRNGSIIQIAPGVFTTPSEHQRLLRAQNPGAVLAAPNRVEKPDGIIEGKPVSVVVTAEEMKILQQENQSYPASGLTFKGGKYYFGGLLLLVEG